jgi:hypothetical protein
MGGVRRHSELTMNQDGIAQSDNRFVVARDGWLLLLEPYLRLSHSVEDE